MEFYISIRLRWSGPEKLNRRRNVRKLNCLCPDDSIVCLHGPISNPQHHSRTPTSQHHGRTPTSQHHGRNSTSPHRGQNSTSPHHGRNSTVVILQNLLNSQPVSSGHDVIHTPAPFPVLGLLWQWWLSYPLRVIVNCTNWLHTWTLNPNSSKLNQPEW